MLDVARQQDAATSWTTSAQSGESVAEDSSSEGERRDEGADAESDEAHVDVGTPKSLTSTSAPEAAGVALCQLLG
jgi:hypothetical protein